MYGCLHTETISLANKTYSPCEKTTCQARNIHVHWKFTIVTANRRYQNACYCCSKCSALYIYYHMIINKKILVFLKNYHFQKEYILKICQQSSLIKHAKIALC